jgi:hypothetical protein
VVCHACLPVFSQIIEIKINAVRREGVGRFTEVLYRSYTSPYFCNWLLSFQASALGHKVLYTVYTV